MPTVEELIAALDDREAADDASDSLTDMGASVLEPLVSAMRDDSRTDQVREICAEVIGRAVPSGVERLLSLLPTSVENDADLTAWGLRWNHVAEFTEPILFEMLGSSAKQARANAARALKYIHVDLRHFDSVLVSAAQDPVVEVRRDILQLFIHLAEAELGERGIQPVDMRRLAQRALHDSDSRVQDLAEELIDALEAP